MLDVTGQWRLQAALEGAEGFAEDAAVQLRAVRGMRLLKLQCLASLTAENNPLARLLKQPLPIGPNARVDAERPVFWLSPNEWLLALGAATDSSQILESLAETQSLVDDLLESRAEDNDHYAVTAVSDAHAVIELSGAGSEQLLGQGCGIDLDASAFLPGQYRSTLFARVPVLLYRLERQRFQLFVCRSVAQHLWQWLQLAAFGK